MSNHSLLCLITRVIMSSVSNNTVSISHPHNHIRIPENSNVAGALDVLSSANKSPIDNKLENYVDRLTSVSTAFV